MAQLQFTVPDFNQSSSWVSYQDDGGPYYSTPTTVTANKTFSLSGLPADAILDSATLYSSLGSPYTGAAIRQIDGVTYSSETQKDILAKLQALNGNYSSGVAFEYKFKANGGQGTTSVSGTPHSSTLAWYNNALTVTYHLPASTFTTTPVSSVNVDMNVTVSISPASTSYTHKVIRSIGENSATNTLAAGVNQYTFQFPASWIPNAASATAMVKVETWSGSTKMGEYSKTMTVNVPNSAPYLPTITFPDPAHVRGYLSSDWPYTKGKSKAQLNATCAAGSGSTVSSVAVSNGASGTATLSGGVYTFTTGYLGSTGTITFRMTVTDARGKTAYADKSITVYDYTVPHAAASTVIRCAQNGTPGDSGTYLKITPNFAYASVNSKNSVNGVAWYRQLPSGSWIAAEEEGPITNYTLDHNDPFITGGGTISELNSYEVKIEARDELYPNVTALPNIFTIGTEKRLIDVAGDTKVAFFGAAENDGFEVKGNPYKEIRYKGQTLDERFGRILIYRNPSDFGLTVTTETTLLDVYNAMSDSSAVLFYPPSGSTTDLSPADNRYGELEIVRLSGVRCWVVFYTANARDTYRNQVYNGTPGEWTKMVWDGASLSDRLTMPRLRLTATTDVAGGSANDVALIIGSQSGEHLEFDGNEIMAKSNGTTPSVLYLNSDGGDVRVNYQTVYHRGNIQRGTGSPPSLPDGYIYIKHV